MSTKLKLMGLMSQYRRRHAKTRGRWFTYQMASEVYKRWWSVRTKQLLGAVLVGDASGYGTLLQYCLNGIELPETRCTDFTAPLRCIGGLGPMPCCGANLFLLRRVQGAICQAIEGAAPRWER
jgi:nitrite reductase (NADH) large subunit